MNGSRGVYLRVFKQPGANTIAVVDAVCAALPQLRNIPPNVKCEISFDQSTYIRSAVSALEHEAVQGGLLAIAVILVFLVSFRATGIAFEGAGEVRETRRQVHARAQRCIDRCYHIEPSGFARLGRVPGVPRSGRGGTTRRPVGRAGPALLEPGVIP